MIYYLKHNIHKLNWTMIGNVLGMVLIAQACLMVLPVIVDCNWDLFGFRIWFNA